MKHITLCCHGCGKVKRFSGEVVKEILTAIDKTGWVDEPDKAWCPKCWSEIDDSQWGEPE